MAGRFDVDVAAVAVGQFLDLLHHVFLARIHDQIGAELLGLGQASVVHVQDDKQTRVCLADGAYHAKASVPAPDRTTTSRVVTCARSTQWNAQA